MSSATAKELAQEFISNLRAMATGSYLREEDKEFWDAPYPESAVDRVDKIVQSMLRAADAPAPRSPSEIDVKSPELDETGENETPQLEPTEESLAVVGALEPLVLQIKALSDEHLGEILDVEEIDELANLTAAIADEAGAQSSVVSGHVRALCED